MVSTDVTEAMAATALKHTWFNAELLIYVLPQCLYLWLKISLVNYVLFFTIFLNHWLLYKILADRNNLLHNMVQLLLSLILLWVHTYCTNGMWIVTHHRHWLLWWVLGLHLASSVPSHQNTIAYYCSEGYWDLDLEVDF